MNSRIIFSSKKEKNILNGQLPTCLQEGLIVFHLAFTLNATPLPSNIITTPPCTPLPNCCRPPLSTDQLPRARTFRPYRFPFVPRYTRPHPNLYKATAATRNCPAMAPFCYSFFSELPGHDHGFHF